MTDREGLMLLLVGLLLAYFLYFWYSSKELFNADGTTVVPLDEPDYGLRGDLLERRPISDYFIRNDRQIRLNDSGGMDFEGNFRPTKEHERNCKRAPCPGGDGYDKEDNCWRCD